MAKPLTFRRPFNLPNLELTFTMRAPDSEGLIRGIMAFIMFLVPK